MEESDSLIKALPIILLIGFFFFVVARNSESDKKQEEANLKKKADALQAITDSISAEVETANRAANLLPDVDGTLNLLREKYGWRELVETLHVGDLQLNLLRMLRKPERHHISLPNMQADRYDASERYAAKEALKSTSPLDDVGFYGIDAYAQEPTVAMLRDLVGWGFVSMDTPITKNSREFECELTPKGLALIALDARFCRGDTAKAYFRREPCGEAKKIIADVMYRCIFEIQKQNQEQKA